MAGTALAFFVAAARLASLSRLCLDHESRILFHSKFDVDVLLFLLDESQCGDLLGVVDAHQDGLSRLYSQAGNRVLGDLDVADLGQVERVKGQEVARRSAHQHVSIVVRSVGQATYQAARLERLHDSRVLLRAIEYHQEGLQLSLAHLHDLLSGRRLGFAGAGVGRLLRHPFLVPAGEKNLAWELLGGALLRVKLAILPVQSRHRNEIDLLHFEILMLKEGVHLEPFDERAINAEDINEGLLLVGGEYVPRVVQYRPYLQVGRAQGPQRAPRRIRRVHQVPFRRRLTIAVIVGGLVLKLVLELDPGRLHMVREGVVEALPVLREVVALEHFEPADLVEANDSALVERYQELAT